MRLIFQPSQQQVTLPDAIRPLAEQSHTEMMDAGELQYLAGALALCPRAGPEIVCEIGAYLGETTVFIAKCLKLMGRQIPILSIDPFDRVTPDPGNPQGSYTGYLAKIRANGLDHVCLPLVAFSEDAAPVVPDTISLLIVDGSHHYSNVKQDLELFLPKVVSGGIIFLDDYIPAYPGVMRAIDETFTSQSPFSILHKTYFVIAQRQR